MRITPIVASTFASDGGAMFGLVPKSIWAKLIPPNDQNRIRQNLNSALIQLEDGRKGLLDTGCGPPENYSEKEIAFHELSPDRHLVPALQQHGVLPQEISFIVLSHLHWDHASGAFRCTEQGSYEHLFPHAVFYIHQTEWDEALSENPLLYKSYPQQLMKNLKALPASRLKLISKDEEEILPGIVLVRTGGHTRGHCIVRLTGHLLEQGQVDVLPTSDPETYIYASDVCPTRHHLRLVFQTAYDTYPLDTRSWKRQWLPMIEKHNFVLLFAHDPDCFGARLRRDRKQDFEVFDAIWINSSP